MASRRGEIVLIRSSDGKRICTLARIEQAKGTVIDLALTPDRKTVFFSEDGLGGCPRIYSVAMRGGHIRSEVNGGYAPNVSPDGKSLAYNASLTCGDRRQRIVIRNLATGREREWIGTNLGGYGDDVVWGPDPRYLLVALCGFDACRYFSLDTKKHGTTLDGAFWPDVDEDDPPRFDGKPITATGISLGALTVRPRTGTVAFGIFYSDEPPDAPHAILEYNPATQGLRVLVWADAAPIDFDPSGKHLLYRAPGLVLMRYSGGRPVRLGAGYFDAAW